MDLGQVGDEKRRAELVVVVGNPVLGNENRLLELAEELQNPVNPLRIDLPAGRSFRTTGVGEVAPEETPWSAKIESRHFTRIVVKPDKIHAILAVRNISPA